MEMTIDPGYEKSDEFLSLTNSDVGYEETKMTLRDDLIGWSNSTDSEIDGESSEGKNYWALLLVTLSVCMVSGNVLVILSVVRERTLQNMTNFFIVSLASADLLVAGLVMPFTIYAMVNWGMWGLPKTVCDFYISLDVICSTSSIFNLVAISIDRFLAVTQPIKYSLHKDKTERAYIVIFICWLASIGIGTPIMFGANPIPETETSNINGSSLNQQYDTLDVSSLAGDNYNTTRAQINSSPRTPVNYHVPGHNFSNGGLKNSISQNYSTTSDEIVKQTSFVCGFYNPEYIIYSSLCSFYIPCVFMVFLYSRIFWEIRKRAHQKAKQKKKPVTVPKTNGTKPVVNTPSVQINAINERDTRPSPAPIASSASTPNIIQDIPNENGPMLTTIQNHNINANDNLAAKRDIQDDLKAVNGPTTPNLDVNTTNLRMEMKPLILTQIDKSSPEEDRTGPISPPPLKPNMAHKACGPNTSLYERARSKTNGKRKVNLNGENKIGNSAAQPLPSIILTSCNKAGDKTVSTIKKPFEKVDVRIEHSSSSNGTEQQITVAIDESEGNRGGKHETIVKSISNVFHVGKRQACKKVTKKEEKIKRKKDKSAAKKERKATKTLAIVLGCFLVCWIPFFTCNIINAICIKYQLGWEPGETAFLITTFIGYINSCLNPVIYTIFNPEFRKAFKKILGLGH